MTVGNPASKLIRSISIFLFLAVATNAGTALGQGYSIHGSNSPGGSKIFHTGTDSTMLQTGTQSTTLEAGTQSTLLEAGTGSTMLQTGTAGALIHGNVEREAGPVTVIFLMDASLSMKDDLEGKTQKIDAAKQVLQRALMKIPTEVHVGVRVFGQSVPAGFECQATALLVPPGIGNRRTIIEKIRRVIPTGMTPLTLALFHAAERDLRKVQGKKTIILITDGAETCGSDPCAYIATLPSRGIKLKLDIVGLDVKDLMAKKQLDCIAKTGGGQYYDASTSTKLIDSVSASVSKAISGEVLLPGLNKGKVINPETPPELVPIVPLGSLDQAESVVLQDNREARKKELEEKARLEKEKERLEKQLGLRPDDESSTRRRKGKPKPEVDIYDLPPLPPDEPQSTTGTTTDAAPKTGATKKGSESFSSSKVTKFGSGTKTSTSPAKTDLPSKGKEAGVKGSSSKVTKLGTDPKKSTKKAGGTASTPDSTLPASKSKE